MSFDHFLWSSTESTLRPMIFVLRLSNSGLMRAMYPSSVLQTRVKSLRCEKRTAHWLPIHWWKSMGPSVVWAVKLGASSPIRNAMGTTLLFGRAGNPNARAVAKPAVPSVLVRPGQRRLLPPHLGRRFALGRHLHLAQHEEGERRGGEVEDDRDGEDARPPDLRQRQPGGERRPHLG